MRGAIDAIVDYQGKVAAGASLAIFYGQFVRDQIIVNNGGAVANVKFFDNSGSNGFAPNCKSCHGYPPITDAATNTAVGLVNDPSPTGSLTAGAHEIHTSISTGYGFTCEKCHYNGMPAPDVYDNYLIQVGFSVFGLSGQRTVYHGQTTISPAATGYDYEATNGTSIVKDGAKTCDNVYCHSDGRTLVDGRPITGRSPAWNGSSPDPKATTTPVTTATVTGRRRISMSFIGAGGWSVTPAISIP